MRFFVPQNDKKHYFCHSDNGRLERKRTGEAITQADNTRKDKE